ncbi:MAG: hypothetical protein CML06_17110 [Pseudomonadales bacterium]|nr:hypothetical protein [Pseudomonadales bacterium]
MKNLEQELAQIEERLLVLEEERTVLLARKQAIQNQLNSKKPKESQFSLDEKVSLFCSLFKGRTDVFSLRWENKQGRSGYSVACMNEWRQGICHKPRIKCSDCSHRVLRSIDNTVIYDHLAGKHTVGLYPLLHGDECWLLAVDFDKTDWQKAATAFNDTCKFYGIDCAVERSRSGNGAHIWIFFSDMVPARDARRLGFTLLDKAMERHAGLSFESYDRLFPNQDIMPEGGFGNLIALPLQNLPRQNGNSVFIDGQFNPYPDQWRFLASLQKMQLKKLHTILERLEENKKPELDLKPWEKSLPIKRDKIGGCPTVVDIVLANKLYLPIEHFPHAYSGELDQSFWKYLITSTT